MVKVFHNVKAFDHDCEFQFMDDAELEEALSLLPQKFLEEVARVETDSLDMAYRLTNHIDQPWYKNPEVTCVCKSRSTSIGDVMERDGKLYGVAKMGFVEFKRYPVPPSPKSKCPVSNKACEAYQDCHNRNYCHLK